MPSVLDELNSGLPTTNDQINSPALGNNPVESLGAVDAAVNSDQATLDNIGSLPVIDPAAGIGGLNNFMADSGSDFSVSTPEAGNGLSTIPDYSQGVPTIPEGGTIPVLAEAAIPTTQTATASTVDEPPPPGDAAPQEPPPGDAAPQDVFTADASRTGGGVNQSGLRSGVTNLDEEPHVALMPFDPKMENEALTQIAYYLSNDNPYIEQAEGKAMMAAASRGLQNSSLAAQAGTAAAIQAMAPHLFTLDQMNKNATLAYGQQYLAAITQRQAGFSEEVKGIYSTEGLTTAQQKNAIDWASQRYEADLNLLAHYYEHSTPWDEDWWPGQIGTPQDYGYENTPLEGPLPGMPGNTGGGNSTGSWEPPPYPANWDSMGPIAKRKWLEENHTPPGPGDYGLPVNDDTGGGGCFAPGTCFRMADGSVKKIEDIKIRDEMAIGGKVGATIIGDGLPETWYDVNGVKVTGTHHIKHFGTWMSVKDAGFDKIDTIDTLYVLINEDHRMVAENGQIFADYMDEDYDALGTGWEEFVLKWMNGDKSITYDEFEKKQRLKLAKAEQND